MNEDRSELGRVVGCILTTIYTVMIYVSNTPTGTERQADFVEWYTILVLATAIMLYASDAKTVLAFQPKTPFGQYCRAWTITHGLLQIILFAITAHFWLMVMRLISFALPKVRLDIAKREQQKIRG